MTEEDYKALSRRLIKYMSDIWPELNLCIVEHKHESGAMTYDLYIHYKALYISEKSLKVWCNNYVDLYKRLSEYRSDDTFITSNTSPEEVDLQLSIRGY